MMRIDFDLCAQHRKYSVNSQTEYIVFSGFSMVPTLVGERHFHPFDVPEGSNANMCEEKMVMRRHTRKSDDH